jgi:mono/diheme cytochrome c family protein
VGWRRLPPASSWAAAGRWPPPLKKARPPFVQHGCWQCHGFQGQGGVTGPKLAPEPMPLETFTAFVRTSNRAMPPYMEAILSNEDLADIHAYLETLPKAPDPKSIPLLNQ